MSVMAQGQKPCSSRTPTPFSRTQSPQSVPSHAHHPQTEANCFPLLRGRVSQRVWSDTRAGARSSERQLAHPGWTRGACPALPCRISERGRSMLRIPGRGGKPRSGRGGLQSHVPCISWRVAGPSHTLGITLLRTSPSQPHGN